MIVVNPMSGQTKIKVTGLYQWDQLRTLEFAKEYPSGTEVHFAIKGETVALVYLLENGAVRIPSVLLQRALPIMAWVNIGEATVLEIEMPVTQRSMPSDYIGIEDDVQNSIEYRTIQLEQWQVEAINQMSDRYTKVETDGKLKLKADANRVYTKLEVNTLLNAVDNGLADRYTKAEADTLLNEKATVTELTDGLDERYTKVETNSLLDEKATVTELTDGLNARYTKDETDGLLAGKVDLADSLTMENLITNGDFSQGLVGWGSISSENSVSGNGMINTADGTRDYAETTASTNRISGNKYYQFAKIKPLSDLVTHIRFVGFTQSLTFIEPTPNIEKLYSGISTSGATGATSLTIRHTYDSNSTSAIEIIYAGVINLTATFGAGNEPTEHEMDKLIDLLGGWFDGEITVSQKQLAIWTLNLIRQNRNAIIQLGGTII